MTKNEMINFIESTKMVIDFDKKALMRRDKAYIESLYNKAVVYQEKKERL